VIGTPWVVGAGTWDVGGGGGGGAGAKDTGGCGP
jgi:hypothetical protein